MKSISRSLLVIAATTVFALGCDTEGEKHYEITVGWNISGQQTCKAILISPETGEPETVDLEAVVVTVYKDKNYRLAPTPQDARVTQSQGACQHGEIVLQDLQRGNYWVTVEAFAQLESDSKAYPYYFGEGALKVPGPANETTNFTLAVGKGDILVDWYFEPKEKCPANGTMKLAMTAGSGINNYSSKEKIECDADGGMLVTGKSWDTYQLTLETYDENNRLTHRGTCVDDDENGMEKFVLHPGETYECWVKLFAI